MGLISFVICSKKRCYTQWLVEKDCLAASGNGESDLTCHGRLSTDFSYWLIYRKSFRTPSECRLLNKM